MTPAIALDLELPLGAFPLRVRAELPGGLTAVMGPSGSGKTSLLEAIAGLRRAVRGRIAVGDDVFLESSSRRRLRPERRRVGYVPQDAGLFPHLSALGNVRFGAREARSRVEVAIDTLEIRPLLARYPSSLSGGEKQRVALARALAAQPKLLLLDEPLASLDVGLRERILPYLRRVRDEWSVPILYVTHNAGEALALAGHVLLLRDGTVEAQGPPLDLLAHPGFRRESEAGLENLLAGTVAGHDETGGVTRIRLSAGGELQAPLSAHRAPGSSVTASIPSEDVVVAASAPSGLSARNVYPSRIVSLERVGADVVLRCSHEGGPAWLVRLTPSAVDALGLAPGRPVWVAVKSHSVRLL
jgi:molybdate transport system ATP-binding protein